MNYSLFHLKIKYKDILKKLKYKMLINIQINLQLQSPYMHSYNKRLQRTIILIKHKYAMKRLKADEPQDSKI